MDPLDEIDSSIAALVRTLIDIYPEITALEIADALFLAEQLRAELPVVAPESMQQEGAELLPGITVTNEAPYPSLPTSSAHNTKNNRVEELPAEQEYIETKKGQQEKTIPLFPDLIEKSQGNRARRMRAPAGRALTDPLGIVRSLRPLMQRIPSRTRVALDIEATVEHVAAMQQAEIQVWSPVLRPQLEQWFTVDFIVDSSPTMAAWQASAQALYKLLEQSGGFRTLVRWNLDTSLPNGPCLFHADGRKCSARSFPTSSSKRLVLVLTDCLSRTWYDGTAFNYLAEWSIASCAAIFQVLPSHLWRRTALSSGPDAHVRAATPAASNRLLPFEMLKLDLEPDEDFLALRAGTERQPYSFPLPRDRDASPASIPIPIVTLAPDQLASWARLGAGRGGPPVPAVLAALSPGMKSIVSYQPRTPSAKRPISDEAITARWLVEVFRGYASPAARRLAVYLTAARPLTLSVLQVIRDALIPNPSEVQIAEILMSGLLREIPGGKPNDPAYDWFPGVQKLLSFGLTVTDLAQVNTAIIRWINANAGSSREFTALTPDSTGTENLVLAENTLPFVRLYVDNLLSINQLSAADRLMTRIERHLNPDAPRGLEYRRSLSGHSGSIFRMMWSPNGRFLATPSTDGSVRLWNGTTGGLLDISHVSKFGINQVAWSHDASVLAAAGLDHILRVWRVSPEGKFVSLVIELKNHQSDIRGIAWSPDEKYLASGTEGGSIRLWDTSDWSLFTRIDNERIAVSVLAWSADANLLAYGREDGKLAIIRRENLRDANLVEHWTAASNSPPWGMTALAWSPVNNLLATGDRNGTIIVGDPLGSDIMTRRLVQHDDILQRAHSGAVSALSYSSNGQILTSKGLDGKVHFWRCDTWEWIATLPEPAGNHTISGLAWHPREPELATLGRTEGEQQHGKLNDQIVRLWHVDIARLLPTPFTDPFGASREKHVSVDLSHKNLTVFPSDISRQLHLEELYVNDNQLSILPPEIGNLTQLRVLHLGGNQLTKLPDEIGNLTNLTHLYLDRNLLTVLTPAIGHLSNLRALHLDNNSLIELPAEINSLAKLSTLHLGHNQVTAFPPNFGELKSMEKLYVDNNRLTQLPDEMGDLRKLTHFHLDNNMLARLPLQIGNLTKLIVLHLGVNHLQVLPQQIGNLSELKELYLDNNRLKELPNEIGGLSQLMELYLDNNLLTSLPPGIGKLSELRGINLTGNRLTSLPNEIGMLKRLRKLHLDNNRLQKLPDGIGATFKLTHIDLHNNMLTELPSNIGDLAELVNLNLVSNRLTKLPNEIGRLHELTNLDLMNNQLKELPLEIGGLVRLSQFVLSLNRLTNLPPQIGELVNLRGLHLKGNQLTEIPPQIGNLTSLEQLDLEDNPLTELPNELGNLSGLWKLLVDDHFMQHPPLEIIELGTDAILEFLRNHSTDEASSEDLD